MKIQVGVSARHIHLSEDDYKILFDEEMEVRKPLKQPGQYASDKKVTIKTNHKEINNVTVIGPFRKQTQVEISETDAVSLRINPPVRKSGDLSGAEEITIKTEKGEITRKACIITVRHIHITKEEREKYNLTKEKYSIKITSEKSGIIDDVHISEAPNSYFELHLDTDDANAFKLKDNDYVEILKD